MLADQEFWYHRTEHLVGRALTRRPNALWNDIYYGLVKAKEANREDLIRASWNDGKVEPRDLSSKLYRPGLSDLDTLLVIEEVYGKPAPMPTDHSKSEIYAQIASVPVLHYLLDIGYLPRDEDSVLYHLAAASSYGRTAVVRELLRMLGPKVGPNRAALVNALIVAAGNHHPDVVKEIASIITLEPSEWYRALSRAVSDTASNSVQYLLDTVDYTKEEIESILPVALTQIKNDQVSAMLIRAIGPDVDRAEALFTGAIANGLGQAARALIDLNPKLNLSRRLDYAALLQAIEKNQVSMVALILDYVSPAHRTNQALKKAAAVDGAVFKLVLADKSIDPNKDLTGVLKAIITQQSNASQTKTRQIIADVEKSKPLTIRRYTDLYMIARRSDVVTGEDSANALILDPRVKVENLSQTDARLFVYALEAQLYDGVRGSKLAGDIARTEITDARLGAQIESSLLMRYILLKRPSGVELMDWCIARRDPAYEKAARQVVLSGGVTATDPTLTPIESLFTIVLYPKLSVEELVYGLREADVRSDAIEDSAVLVGAYLGQTELEARSPPRRPPPE